MTEMEMELQALALEHPSLGAHGLMWHHAMWLPCKGEQHMPPLNVALWHMDYFELKTIKAQRTQEESLTFPPKPK